MKTFINKDTLSHLVEIAEDNRKRNTPPTAAMFALAVELLQSLAEQFESEVREDR